MMIDPAVASAFDQAADKESVESFFGELKGVLSDLQKTVEKSFIGTKAAFEDSGRHCVFYLYEDLIGDKDDECEKRICAFDFMIQGYEVSCVGEPLSWRPDQKELCFQQVNYLVMREFFAHDQRNFNKAMRGCGPAPDNRSQ